MAQAVLSSLAAPSSAADSVERHWFAVYTAYRQEKRVAARLKDQALEHYLPVYRPQQRWWRGMREAAELPLFPCYVFVRIAPEDRLPVLEDPGVLWMVGDSGSQPTPISQPQIETLRAALDPARIEPHPLLTVGPRVRVVAGRLAGIEGIAVRGRAGLRVVVTLEPIMQSLAVEIDAGDLQPVGPSPAGPSPLPFAESRQLALCRF